MAKDAVRVGMCSVGSAVARCSVNADWVLLIIGDAGICIPAESPDCSFTVEMEFAIFRCNCGFAYFSFQFYQFVLHRC